MLVCDECLMNPSSPKRKQPNLVGNLVQSTIEVNNSTLTLSKTNSALNTPSRSAAVKTNQQLQSVVEELVQKVTTQSNTISGLQASIETMNGTVSQQTAAIAESSKISNDNYSSIKQSLGQFNESVQKQGNLSYAEIAKRGIEKRSETPKLTKANRTPRRDRPVTGTSNNVIGKPISPNQPKTAHPKPEKAVWLSKIHRDATEEELTQYISDTIGITSTEVDVRKLVKKDRDISEYSFVSFRIACKIEHFNRLMDPMYWPSNSLIREFDLNRRTSNGAKLIRKEQQIENVTEQPKNEETSSTISPSTPMQLADM